MANAYARKDDTKNEFAIYDAVLQELASKAQNVPLGSPDETYNSDDEARSLYSRQKAQSDNEGSEQEGQSDEASSESDVTLHKASQSFQVATIASPTRQGGTRSPEYARVLERYLARLVQMKQIPPALVVLSHEIERNPDDPGLYERLAVFLDQNRLGSQQEEIYRRAMARFPRQILV